MEYRVTWSPEAVEDLELIAEYIERDSSFYAQSVVSQILALSRKIKEFPLIGRVLPEIGDENIHLIAGGETAGIPYAALIAERMHKPMIYVRKEPKGHGRMAQIEGVLPGVKKKTDVLLVEDLQTDGGSKKVFVDALRKAKTNVKHGFVLFHYGIFKQSEKNMKSLGIKLHALATWHDVLEVAKRDKYFDKATLKSVESFLKKPEGWSP